MRASKTASGITLRVVAGTTNIILGMDFDAPTRKGCLGFSVRRVDLGPAAKPLPEAERTSRWLPNMLRFPTDRAKTPPTTLDSPLQKFRWGDYTCEPGHTYRYQVVPRYGAPGALTPKKPGDADGVTVEVTTEDNAAPDTAVFFNRAAAASRAFDVEFPSIKTEAQLLADTPAATAAKEWLSRGLEKAVIGFIGGAKDEQYVVHAAIYEFQKESFLAALAAAAGRKAEVEVVFHHRTKGDKDTTAAKNMTAIKKAKLPAGVKLTPRNADPQGAIMHNKFIILLKKGAKNPTPLAVWTGSTNWTDGAIYGQLNVGHAIYDKATAATYEAYFQLLKKDLGAEDMKHELAALTPVSTLIPVEHGVTPIFSPQQADTMLHLYSAICARAKCLMVCAPFALSPIILAPFSGKPAAADATRFFLLDKEGSLGKGEDVTVIENDPHNAIGIAVTLPSALHDFQGNLLQGKGSFRHAGIHIHSKIILADPFGSDPTLVTGSANFSRNSTEVNDSNSLMIRGATAVADIYATEFMRMFEHYHFRAKEADALTHAKAAAKGKAKPKASKAKAKADVLGLVNDDSWSTKYFVRGSAEETDRRMFAGTLH